jgi:hypothetical protein
MLNDPLVLFLQPVTTVSDGTGYAVTNNATPVEFHGVGGGGIGASVRVQPSFRGGKATLSINHSQSKENAPYTTDRSVIRIDLKKPDSTGKLVQASAYCVVALPQGNVVSRDDCLVMVNTLLAFLLHGSQVPGLGFPDSALELSRILDGEP